MDVVYFLKRRTAFVRLYYETASAAFADIKRRIEDKEAPFDDPPYSEDPEPPVMEAWMDAEPGRHIGGLSCLSLLSDSLKLYLQTLQSRVIGFRFTEEEEKTLFKRGFLGAYLTILGEIYATDWSDCPVDWSIVEQVVLARNRTQHGTQLTTLAVGHDAHMQARRPSLFFVRDEERAAWDAGTPPERSFLDLGIVVTRANLEAAILEIETLAVWLETNLPRAMAWRERLAKGAP